MLNEGLEVRDAPMDRQQFRERLNMGKYVFAWLLGVPAFVLVIIYFFAH